MTLSDVISTAIAPALALLPAQMDTPQARVMLLSIGLQESRFTARQQDGGPAHSFWQFEEGTAASKGGVWGLYLHSASAYWLSGLCDSQGVSFDPASIYNAIVQNDVLAAGCARLMLFTDPRKLPAVDDVQGSWQTYVRVWNPGKPKPDTWPALHAQAVAAVVTEAA
ncbi:hypothetical protein BCh11DRAFT_06496 [Burkholderia sp. Ch1-1]|nr:hypothetical protein BCh11DRAFT_06496 [Burkholderia sp. Ch1-1]